jgi:Ca2+-binding RTX toxin-like protein
MAKFVGQWFMSNLINGTDGADDIQGMGFADVLRGGGGRDTIDGGGGDDRIFGDDGDDTLFGGAGKDELNGGRDNDTLDGGAGDDTLNGDSGADTFNDVHGNNTFNGGADRDTVDYSDFFGGRVRVDLAAGTAVREDKINVANSSSFYFLTDGNDTLSSIENIDGSTGDDILKGNDSTNFIQGGRGNDALTGRGGADYFVFADDDVNFGRDTIMDFDSLDQIDLRQVDARTDVNGNQSFTGFVDNFTGHSGELILRVFADHAVLFGDTDGDGSQDFSFQINGDMSALSQNDFML